MATWTTLRNQDLDEAAQTDRGLQFLAFLDTHLVDTAGWTRIGTGSGTAGSTNWSAVSVLATYPAITSMALDAWGVWENVDGVQVCCKVETNISIETWISPGGNFVSTSTTAILPPSETGTAPADMITVGSGNFVGASTNKITMAYSGDGNSVIIFGRRGAGPIYNEFAFVLVKLEGTKTGDVYPAEFPYWSFIYGNPGFNIWSTGYMSSGVSSKGWGSHPTTGPQEYGLMELWTNLIAPFTVLPVDPISGNAPRMECIVACSIAGSEHIRGKAPGIFRVSAAVHGTGDRLDDAGGGVYDWIVMGDYAVPWFSSDALSW